MLTPEYYCTSCNNQFCEIRHILGNIAYTHMDFDCSKFNMWELKIFYKDILTRRYVTTDIFKQEMVCAYEYYFSDKERGQHKTDILADLKILGIEFLEKHNILIKFPEPKQPMHWSAPAVLNRGIIKIV